MTLAIQLDHSQNEQFKKNTEKTAIFSSNIVNIANNTPSTLYAYITVPLIVPLANFALWRLNIKIRKTHNRIKKELLQYAYDDCKSNFQFIGMLINLMKETESSIKPASEHFLTRGIYSKFIKSIKLLTEMQQTVSSVLYVDTTNQPPLSEEEKETFKRLNEVWGNDDDEVYAKETHYFLKKELQCNGL